MACCTTVVKYGETPAFLQRRGLNISAFSSFLYAMVSGNAGTMISDSAKFDEPQPDDLRVSDDSWASLKLRVDPLARAVLDPHNLYLAGSGLILLLTLVYRAVRPSFDYNNGDDDDYYIDDDFNDRYNKDDDFWKQKNVANNQWRYENALLAREQLMWTIGFTIVISAVIVIAGLCAYMMEARNSRVDAFIQEVIGEVTDRFQQEGYAIEYKSASYYHGPLIGHFFPERVIVFHELTDEEMAERKKGGGYMPPTEGGSAQRPLRKKKKKESSFGTINVMVPDGYKPGQVVNVMTPSGLPIMVAVPSGIPPGQSFPVQIPAQMYRPRK